MGRLWTGKAVKRLLPLVKDADMQVRLSALRALAEGQGSRDPRIVDAFISALHDHEAPIRTEAIRLLAAAKDSRAVPPLIAALREYRALDEHQGILKALQALSGKDFDEDADHRQEKQTL